MVSLTSERGLKERTPSTGVAGIITEIRAEVAACRLCPAMAPFRKSPPDAFGTTTTGYMLVGDAPGKGPRPYDEKGSVLREALTAVGDPRYRDLEDLFFLTDAIRCAPPHRKERNKTRAPTRVECRTCRAYLGFEIRTLHPRLVIAVGSRAAEAVLGEPVKIGEIHGHRHRRHDAEILTLIMPSRHNRITLGKLDMTIESYRRWLTGLFGALVDDLA